MVIPRLEMMGCFRPPSFPRFLYQKEIKRTMSLYFGGDDFKIRASNGQLELFTGDTHTASWKGIKKPHVVDLGLDLQTSSSPSLLFAKIGL